MKGQRQTSNPRLFALLIGIDNYNKGSPVSSSHGLQASSLTSPKPPVFTNLRGAVADAKEFYAYLISDLGVPENHITLLSNAHATRQEIIKAFRKLGDDDKIRVGDSILIFYAGLGAQALPPKRLLSTPGCPQHIELLIPYDYTDNPDPEYQTHMGIPDYTLAALLNKIAQNKGDNITVIFDCCYSASDLRGLTTLNPTSTNHDSQSITRGCPELNYHMPDGLDEEIWGGRRGLSVLPRLRHSESASYVFFAACASYELAKEKNGQGCFTSALLILLRELGSHALSCSQIISHLSKIDGQHPQCEGIHKDRAIFHRFTSLRTKRFFNVRTIDPGSQRRNSYKQSPQFILDAGSFNGFSEGDEFTVYKSRSDNDQNNPLGSLIIDKFTSDGYILKVPNGGPFFSLPCNSAPILLTKPARTHFQLYIDSGLDKSTRISLLSLISQLNLPDAVFITPDRRNAHVSLSIHNHANLRFEVVDADLIDKTLDCGYHLVRADVGKEELAWIFKGLTHYYLHLKSDSIRPAHRVDISFYNVEEYYTYDRDHGFEEEELRVVHGSVNLYNSKTRVLEVEIEYDKEGFDEPKLYGLKLTNQTRWDLFPTLFYFDNTDFTISSVYPPSRSKWNPEPPLKIGSSLTIGYGKDTAPPFTFNIPEGQNMDIGFFKLILSTSPIDLRGVEQPSSVFHSTRFNPFSTSLIEPSSIWSSHTITVIQHKKS